MQLYKKLCICIVRFSFVSFLTRYSREGAYFWAVVLAVISIAFDNNFHLDVSDGKVRSCLNHCKPIARHLGLLGDHTLVRAFLLRFGAVSQTMLR
jgi:hypothetical protein